MHRRLLTSLAFCAAFGCASLTAADPTPPKGFTALFDGKTLEGWHGRPAMDLRKFNAMSEADRKAQIEKWTDEVKKRWRVGLCASRGAIARRFLVSVPRLCYDSGVSEKTPLSVL